MDDLPFNCNKSTIYVLNTNYNYGNFGEPITDRATPPCLTYQSPDQLLPRLIGNSESYTNTSNNTGSGNNGCGVSAIANFFPCSNAFGNMQQKSSPFNVPHQLQQQHHPIQFNHHQLSTLRQQLQKDQNCISPATIGQTKKFPAIKSTIIAKKTKFWKFLEEEKWKNNMPENLPNSNCERNSTAVTESKSAFQRAQSHSNSQSSVEARNPPGSETSLLEISKSKSVIETNINGGKSSRQTTIPNNISRNNRKSSIELYHEAVQLLGLSCTLCDNCRCIDCQSRYFECDDDDFDCDDSLEDYIDAFCHFDSDESYDMHGLCSTMQSNCGQISSASCDQLNSNNNNCCSYKVFNDDCCAERFCTDESCLMENIVETINIESSEAPLTTSDPANIDK